MSTSWYEPTAGNQYRVIPGAGTYLQSQAGAQSAYEKAKAQLEAQRAQRQISSGLGKDWQVDPRAQYGAYQQMLQQQGAGLDTNQEQNQQRGFFGRGLGNQGESMLRYANAAQALGFQNQLSSWENEYQQGLMDIQQQQQEAMLSALQDAQQYAYQNEDYTPYDPYSSSGTHSLPQVPIKSSVAPVRYSPLPGGTNTSQQNVPKKKPSNMSTTTFNRLRAGRM